MMTRKGTYESLAAFALLLGGAYVLGTLAFLVGALLVAVLLTGKFQVSAHGLTAERHQAGQELVEDQSISVRLRFHNPSRWPGLVEFEDPLPRTARVVNGEARAELVLAGRAAQEQRYEAKLPLRGEHDVGPVHVRFLEPFRNHVEERTYGATGHVTVFPRRLLLDDFSARSKYVAWLVGQHLVNSPGHGADFFSLRDYQASDRIRDINWKASARRGMDRLPVVNQRTRESYAEVLVILDAREAMGVGWETYSPLAQGCRAVLTLLGWVHRRRDSFRLLIVGDTVSEARPGNPDRQTADVTGSLTELRPEGRLSIRGLLEGPLAHAQSNAPIVFISSLEDPTLTSVATDLRSRGHQVTVLIPLPTFRFHEDRPGPGQVLPSVRRAMDELRAHEVRVVPWSPDVPLAVAAAEVAG